jgi:endonuclease/exonuclease/phosphatase family metal-dependent hydrolase
VNTSSSTTTSGSNALITSRICSARWSSGTPKKARDEQHVKVKLASYNVNMIRGTNWDVPEDQRAEQILDVIKAFDPDVVVLDEVFTKTANDMVDALTESSALKYRTPVVGRKCSGDGWDGTYGNCSSKIDVIRGGTVIVSKWPILQKYQYIYRSSYIWSWDYHANKGVALVQIAAPGGGNFWVAGTHLQASDSDVDPKWGFPWGHYEQVRDSQLLELGQFIEQRADWTDEVVLIAGDLNVPVYIDKLNESDLWATRPDHFHPDGGGVVYYDNGGFYLKLVTTLLGSEGGVSVDCLTNTHACLAQNKSAQYPPGYRDSLDYIGFLDNWGRPVPLDMTPPVTERDAAWKSGAGYSPSDHYPVMATFTLGFDDDGNAVRATKGSAKNGNKKAGGNGRKNAGGNRASNRGGRKGGN